MLLNLRGRFSWLGTIDGAHVMCFLLYDSSMKKICKKYTFMQISTSAQMTSVAAMVMHNVWTHQAPINVSAVQDSPVTVTYARISMNACQAIMGVTRKRSVLTPMEHTSVDVWMDITVMAGIAFWSLLWQRVATLSHHSQRSFACCLGYASKWPKNFKVDD